MAEFDPRIDDYIENAASFAQPILRHIRALVHESTPEVEETWKWSFPCFMYRNEMFCSMAAFKNHCSFGFWKASLIKTGEGIFSESGDGMGQLGKLRSLADLPPDGLIRLALQEAMILNETKQKVPRVPKTQAKPTPEVPDEFQQLLHQNPAAALVFEKFSPSKKREYLEWFLEAKTESTRTKRMAEALVWIGEGKIRNWKYVR